MMIRRVLIGLALLAAAALALSIWRFNVAPNAGAKLSGEMRAEFVRSAIESCSTLQKASPDNSSVAPETIASYCRCYADGLADEITPADLDALRGKSATEAQTAMRPKMAKSEDACFAKLEEKK